MEREKERIGEVMKTSRIISIREIGDLDFRKKGVIIFSVLPLIFHLSIILYSVFISNLLYIELVLKKKKNHPQKKPTDNNIHPILSFYPIGKWEVNKGILYSVFHILQFTKSFHISSHILNNPEKKKKRIHPKERKRK